MGRHSAPEDTDEDVDTDVRPVDDGPNADIATEPAVGAEPDGRHANRAEGRPRPAPDTTAHAAAAAPAPADDDPQPEGLSLLDDAFGPASDVADADADADAPTTTMDLSELARDDRPLPEETTARIAPVIDAPPDVAPPPVDVEAPTTEALPAPAAATGPAAARGRHATSADLALIRRHGDVRARVIAAVLAPFVVFVAVLAVRGNLDVHSLVWIWIPAVVAGVLVGVLLDAGHKRYSDHRPSTGP